MATTMLPSQTAYISAMKAGRTLADKDKARAVDKPTHAKLNKLRAQPVNAVCFECDARGPGWAVLPWGCFVCIDCAQLHRNLGRHISQTKAINTGTYLWLPDEVAVMEEVGNAVAAKAFAACPLPAKPTRDSTPAQKEEYVRLKYASGFQPQWLNDDPATRLAPPTAPFGHASQPPLAPCRAVAIEKPASPPPPHPQSLAVLDLINFDDPPVSAPPPALPGSGMSQADALFFAQFGL